MDMNEKLVKEYFVDAIWGKIALLSWGDSSKEPALLLHGFMDSAATWLMLAEQLPNTHYYVALDLPGHGKSDPFPLGPLVNVGCYVAAVHAVVEHCHWTQFVFVAHSLGFITGVMYNQAYPHTISRMINIDPALVVSQLYFTGHPELWAPERYQLYYAEVQQLKHKQARVFTREQAIQYILRRRSLTEKQAELVVSRSLVPAGEGRYKLSWGPNAKLVTMLAIPVNTFYIMLISNPKPMLILNASEDVSQEVTKAFIADFMKRIRNNLPILKEVTIEGGHDIHITNPGDCAKHITEFLNNVNRKSKI